MDTKIIFTGTAGDHVVMGKQARSSGGIIIQTPTDQYHLNPGPGALVKNRVFSINSRETTVILATNDDLINSNDINVAISAMTLNGLDRKGIALVNQHSSYLTKKHESMTEKTIHMHPGKRIGIHDTDIIATPSTREDSTGFLFHLPHVIVGYVGDTGYTDALIEAYKGTNILISKCVLPSDHIEKNVLNLEDIQKLVKAIQPDLCILTGFGSKMLETDLLNQARTVQKATGVQTIIANDGLRISPSSYSSGQSQKKLSGF